MPSAREGGRPLELVVNEPSESPSAPSPPPPASTETEQATVRASAAPTPAVGSEQAVLVERRKRHAELMERRALRRAEAAEAAVREGTARLEQLELELAEARGEGERLRAEGRGEGERLRAELTLAERKRREAAQLAHSEAAIRGELEREHADRLLRHEAAARAVLELLEGVQARARRLRREVEVLRRASAAVPDRSAAAGAGVEQTVAFADPRARTLAAELMIARSIPPAPRPAAPSGAEPPPPDLRGELEQEQSARARLEADLEEARLRTAYVTDAIEGIGRQLDTVRAAAAGAPPAAEAVAARAAPAASPPVGEQAAPPAGGRNGEDPDPRLQENGAVAPDRLAAALHRLREESPRPEEPARDRGGAGEPERVAGPVKLAHEAGRAVGPARDATGATGGSGARLPDPAIRRSPGSQLDPAQPRAAAAPWLRPTLKRLLREDPAIAGRLVTHLLPAQRLVAGPIRYDLVLGDAGCLAVTVRDDEVRVDLRHEPRPVSECPFRIEGDLAGLGRLLVYGPLRRRLWRGVAAVRGGRGALGALEALVAEPLSLRELDAAGVRLDPGLTLQLVAGMIDPSWTEGERFTLGHESRGSAGRAYLLVRDGARVCVSRSAPLGPVASTVLCPDGQLLTLLAGGSPSEATVLGAAGPVARLRDWIARAERG
jgi:hypothetical protein